MKSILKNYFGYDEFRPLQEDIIKNVLGENDTFVLMPTGGGKSLCFQLPALMLDGLTLVISPLIALMKDQVDALQANGIQAEFINSSMSSQDNFSVQQKILNHEVKILYVAPERLATPSFQNLINQLNSFDDNRAISLIAIDEAHCISEWGHDFRPDYKNLSNLKNWFPGTPLIALTATATPKVKDDVLAQLQMNTAQNYVSSFDRENLNIQVVRKKNSYDKIIHLLEKYKGESCIIYCYSRKDTERIAFDLKTDGFSALPYHAGLSSDVRRGAQDDFIKDKIDIIVATIAFGMGIDKPDVRLLIHHTFPKTIEGYYQEIGRAGRDSLPSECVLFYSIADRMKHEYFHDEITDENELMRTKQKLSEMISYCETQSCRHKHLLNYFGEKYMSPNCNACDICLSEKTYIDATIITQKILSAIVRTKNKFGGNYIADVLLGKKLKRIVENGDDKLSVFGIVKDFSADDIKHFIKLLFSEGLISYKQEEYKTYMVSSKGRAFLKQKETIQLQAPTVDKFAELDEIDVTEYEYDQVLFKELRLARKEIAESMNVPPFIIFNDVALQEMSLYYPINLENFGKITGVGEQKLANYGEQFIGIISNYTEKNNIEPKDIPRKKKKKSRSEGKPRFHKDDRYKVTKEMIKKKMSIEEIANEHGYRPKTIIRHIEVLLQEGESLDIDYLKPSKEAIDSITNAFKETEDDKLKPVFELLNEKYSYDDINIVKMLLKQGE